MKSLIVFLITSMLWAHSTYGQKLENLPKDVPAYKVDIILHYGEHVKAYIIDVTDEGLWIVPDKSMVEDAVREDCVECTLIQHRDIYYVKGRKRIPTIYGIAGAIIGAGIILTLSADSERGDGLSERDIATFYVIGYGIPIVIFAALTGKQSDYKSYHPIELKTRSSKIQFFRKCGETVRDFSKYSRLGRKYKFYIDDNMRMVEGKLISKEPNVIKIQPKDSNQLLSISLNRIKCVKK